MKRKIFILLLLIKLTVSVSSQNISDFDYTENDGKITITFYRGRVKDVIIPGTINGKPVVAIGQQAFAGTLDTEVFSFPGAGLTSVVIPDSVKTIGKHAFAGNRNMTNVTINNGVITIGHSAFWACSLTSITIPNSVITIGDSAFFLNQLTSVTIPNSVTTIEQMAFSRNPMTSITFGNSVKKIGWYAFDYCRFTTVTIPSSVTSISGNSFSNCINLTEINIDASNTTYCSVDGVVYNKAKTVLIEYPVGKTGNFTIPNSVTSIGDFAFYTCSNLIGVTIPDSVTSIGSQAFSYCIGITSVTIPNSVINIGSWAFSHCNNLTSVTFLSRITSANLSSYDPFDGDLRAKYLAGGIGTYTRPNGTSKTWTKQ